jgi:hypothetical protein
MGRKKLPDGQARDHKVMTKIRRAAAEAFRTRWTERGFPTEADAVRHALDLFMKEKP